MNKTTDKKSKVIAIGLPVEIDAAISKYTDAHKASTNVLITLRRLQADAQNIIGGISDLLENGLPECSAKDIQAAMGPQQLAIIRKGVNAFKEAVMA